MYILFILCFFKIVLSDLVVNTSSGPIRGVSSLTKDVEAFLGIPYAEPPIKELRFAKPVPKKHWAEVYNASNLPPPCSQLDVGQYYFMPDITNMSEDCLYLNVWAPKSASTDGLRPVIIYIHPGAFLTGSSNLEGHDGSHLASRGDLVVVTINYRLGALGYFFSQTDEAEGNMGMYDQIMAIKWVKDNAKQFCANPENIILMGVSAGAYSVSAHMISPLSRNLFRRAIIQSGSILSPALTDDNAKLFENSQSVASMVGCTNETSTLESDPHSVIQCLKNKPKEDIVGAEKVLAQTNLLVFYPRVNDSFLPKSPVDLIREGKFRKDVDVMMGITNEEGTLLLILAMQDYFGHYGKNNETNINKHRANAISRAILLSMGEPNSSKLVKFYVDHVKDRTPIGYTKMIAGVLGDFTIKCSTVFLADFLSIQGNPVYFYKFEFRPPSTPMADWVGSTHLDEVQYVFGNPYHENFTAEEKELSNRLIDRWSSFARTGNPNIPGHMPWLKYSHRKPLYLHFGQEEESIRLKPSDSCEVWRQRFNAQLHYIDPYGIFQTMKLTQMFI